ncbi:MAG TPA: hypothetical protein VF791_13065 [Pyrinomonadaceae bacterium]
MSSLKFTRIILAAALTLTFALYASQQALAQNESSAQAPAKANTTGLEVQLHLLVATKATTAEDERLPPGLDGVLKQLRTTFTFKNYRLAATLLNRVKNGGRLNLRWVGGPLLASSAATTATPGFNEFNVNSIKLVQDEAGRDAVEMSHFNFGARIPIQLASVAMTGTNPSAPVIQYEQTGITTDITIREGEPTIVGTLNVGPSGDALIIVVSAKRPAAR